MLISKLLITIGIAAIIYFLVILAMDRFGI